MTDIINNGTEWLKDIKREVALKDIASNEKEALLQTLHSLLKEAHSLIADLSGAGATPAINDGNTADGVET
ncbi:MAG: hypothetical protein LBP55_09580 [Candidatus Adiutrix sp.]|jgi:hypothetical protein|nr:hypothetical protein [Candidatus Adiutrix sp.]